jgi:hypothetical protein
VPFIQSMITSYFSIVRQTVQDMVPKAIMHYLVNETCETVQNRLVKALYKDSLFADLLQEDETTLADRNRVKATLDAYKEAFRVSPLLPSAFVAHEWHRNCRITLRPRICPLVHNDRAMLISYTRQTLPFHVLRSCSS